MTERQEMLAICVKAKRIVMIISEEPIENFVHVDSQGAIVIHATDALKGVIQNCTITQEMFRRYPSPLRNKYIHLNKE